MKHSILKKITAVPMKRVGVVLLSIALLTTMAMGGTIAFLTATPAEVTNKFSPAKVTVTVDEDFNEEETPDNIKKNVTVKNTSNIDAYVRVKLISYRIDNPQDENGNWDRDSWINVGGLAPIPEFTLGKGWVEHNGCYYYTLPVAPGSSPANPLIGSDGILLEDSYAIVIKDDHSAIASGDFDGGKQVIEVMAEAIQALPSNAVQEAWGIEVNSDGSLTLE